MLWLIVVLLVLVVVLQLLLLARGSKAAAPVVDRTPELLGQLGAIERVTQHQLGQVRSDLQGQRAELASSLGMQQGAMVQNLSHVREAVEQRLSVVAEGLARTATEARAEQQRATEVLAKTLSESAALNRGEDRKANEAMAQQLRDRLGEMAQRLDQLTTKMTSEAAANRETLEQKMAALQQSNEQRLEQMRATVDEKLHATLEARLGQSFALVSERLEQVQKGLGEMKSLADGVGDLKKVMSNVRARGTWGEVQLRALIEDILRPEEYVANFAPRQRGERVEFAVRLPGQGGDDYIYLPIDAKFPVEDYQRLVDAMDAGDAEAARVSSKALEDRIKGCAKDVRDKYLEPGVTTEYALLFLPSEGLYAEVLRRPGLAEVLQRDYRVAVCGPTTLAAVLNSLRMGFRAVAIQKRSGDIAALLGAVKTEFGNFGKVIDAVGQRLRQAQDEIEKVNTRTRAINRKLRDVDALPQESAVQLLEASAMDDSDE